MDQAALTLETFSNEMPMILLNHDVNNDQHVNST